MHCEFRSWGANFPGCKIIYGLENTRDRVGYLSCFWVSISKMVQKKWYQSGVCSRYLFHNIQAKEMTSCCFLFLNQMQSCSELSPGPQWDSQYLSLPRRPLFSSWLFWVPNGLHNPVNLNECTHHGNYSHP